ncbi:MAG: DNA-binding NtrC family response regulator [Desulforhopalus sp.]|jgi:DNA-binding NtrC family response regulator
MSTLKNPDHPILVIDDEESILLSIDTTLQLAGLNNIITCSDSRQVIGITKKKPPCVILLDLNMPHVDGEAILDQIQIQLPNTPVIIITGRIDAATAVNCMKSGAFDYIVKPVDENRLVASVKKSLLYSDLHRENLALKERIKNQENERPEAFKNILTQSPKMESLFGYAVSVAPTSQPLLIRGETGTGKELMAKAVHNLSNKSGEFVAVNVAGLDDNMFSDTLFGHVKGAFTGADSYRPGLIEKAASGTLFLDEIGDLNSNSQIKLLRLLQEKEYLPIGQDQYSTSSARIITSTHVDLWQLQREGLFREDLHYRLRTHRITLPPLRERKEDLLLLCTYFAKTSAVSLDKKCPTFPAEMIPLLSTYNFPGNIRELQAMVFDAIAQNSNGILPLTAFKNHINRTKNTETAGESIPITFADPLPTLKEATQLLILEAMERSGHNQSTAATMLGISQQALSKRLKNMGSE